jgi:hypothetical protein
MPLEDEIHARLRELTREVRKVREGLREELRSTGRKRRPQTADERNRAVNESTGGDAPDPPKRDQS